MQENTVLVTSGRNLEKEKLCVSFGVITWKVADPNTAIGATLLMLVDDMLVAIKVVEYARLVAPKRHKMYISHDL